MVSEPVLCRSFIGRAAELDHLATRRRAAAGGRGGVVLIAGEAGVGKSRLLAEFRRSLPRRTTRIGWGGCREFAQRPLGPWFEILGALDGQASALLSAGTFASKDEQMAALVDTFERLAKRSTTLVFLEDLHWADPDIVQVLVALSRLASDRRLLFVGTYRDDELTAGHPAFPLISKLLRERATSLVRLAPLDEREMMQLLNDALRSAPPLADAIVRDVRRRADGNALFGEELLRHALDRRRHGDDALAEPLPISLDAIVHERLKRARRDDRELLVRASLIGRTFAVDLLADAFNLSPDNCREAMDRLAVLQLVDRVAPESSEYRFRHALTRDAVYGEIPVGDLPVLHASIAHTIADRGEADQNIEWLAHHYTLAGERERAAPYDVAAGDAARAVHAYEDAATWYERAADAFDESVDGAAALARAGLMHVFCGKIDGALASYERASAIYERCDRYDDAVAARVMAASALYDNGRIDDAIALLCETRDRIGARVARDVRDRLLVRLGFLYAFARRTDEAWSVARDIDAEALAKNSPLEAEAHFLRSALHAQRAEPALWREHFERGLATFERMGALQDHVRAAFGNAGVQALALGETAVAVDYQTRALEQARVLNSAVDFESCVTAEIELRRGNLDAASGLLAATYGQPKFITRVQRALVAVMLATLRGDEALPSLVDMALLDEAAQGGQRTATIKLATAYAAALTTLERHSQADCLLEQAAKTLSTAYDMTVPIVTIVRLRPDLLVSLEPIVIAAAERPADRVSQAVLSLVESTRARERGDAEGALSAGRRAARQFAELEWRVLEAQAYEIGGDETAATRIYRKIGAYGEVRRLERERTGTIDIESARGILTPREREVARAVADGKSNRAAASALSISEKAVEKYLTSIYAKLGMTSRAQLILYITERRRRDPRTTSSAKEVSSPPSETRRTQGAP